LARLRRIPAHALRSRNVRVGRVQMAAHELEPVSPSSTNFRREERRRWKMWTVEDRERYKDDGRRYASDLTDAEWELVRSLFETYRTLTKDLAPLPVRWRIEATFGTLTNRYRRLTRNLEQSGEAAESVIEMANLRRVLRVLTRLNQNLA
jgi:hypothetical protein